MGRTIFGRNFGAGYVSELKFHDSFITTESEDRIPVLKEAFLSDKLLTRALYFLERISG